MLIAILSLFLFRPAFCPQRTFSFYCQRSTVLRPWIDINRKQSNDEILQHRCGDMWTQPSKQAHLSLNTYPTICRSKVTHTKAIRVPSLFHRNPFNRQETLKKRTPFFAEKTCPLPEKPAPTFSSPVFSYITAKFSIQFSRQGIHEEIKQFQLMKIISSYLFRRFS